MTLPRVMVAPTGARLTKADHPALPMTIAEIVETAVACRNAGAEGLHAHIRDAEGRHVLDAGLYRELLAELSQATPGLYVQITTEAVGLYSPAEQRALVENLRPAAVSIALREITQEGDERVTARFFASCKEAGIEVQHILYDAGDVQKLAGLLARGTVRAEGLAVLHVLGRYRSGQVSDPNEIGPLLAVQAEVGLSPDWALCAFGPSETDCLVSALALGGKARIGFENNRLNRDGSMAADNAARVRDLMEATAGDQGAGAP